MSIWTVLITIFTPLVYAQTMAAEVIKFDDLPKLVRERNENVNAAKKVHLAEKERIGYLTRSFLPQISARAGNESFKTGSVGQSSQDFWTLEGKVNLYRGGRDQLEAKVREANEHISEAQYSGEFVSELREARKTYWKLVAVGALIKDQQEAVEKNELHIKSSLRRSGAGVATNADTIQFELHKTLLQQSLKRLKLKQNFLKNKLSVSIGREEHENIQVADDFPQLPDNKETFPNLKRNENIELNIASEREARATAKSRQHSRWWVPQIDLYTSYGIPSLSEEYDRALRNEREWTVGVQIGVDLGEAFESKREAKAKLLEAQAEQAKANHRKREVVAADHELRHDLNLLHELIQDADRDRAKAESFLKLTNSEYARGVKNSPDLLQAFQSYFEFRARRTLLYQEYHETRADLLALLAKHDEP